MCAGGGGGGLLRYSGHKVSLGWEFGVGIIVLLCSGYKISLGWEVGGGGGKEEVGVCVCGGGGYYGTSILDTK